MVLRKKSKNIISDAEVIHVAKLANLNLTAEEIKKYQSQFSQILVYFQKLNQIDTVSIPELHQITGLKNIFRQDEVKTGRMLSVDAALSSACKKHHDYFVVKAVIKKT